MKVLITLLSLAIVHNVAAAPSWYQRMFGSEEQTTANEPPAFCKGRECPEFRVVQKYEGYELREYSKSTWVSVKFPSMEGDYWQSQSGRSETFHKLFDYIRGANSAGQKIEMTSPVVMTHFKDAVWMNFLIPAEFAASPPTPTDPEVKIYKEEKKGLFYVRSFDGFAYGIFGYSNYYKTEINTLKDSLTKDGRTFAMEPMFFTAGYDAPWDLFNRHNEVWIPKK